MASENLNKSIVKGVSWNFIESFSGYVIRFVIGIILARLLSPSDYGLIGMLTIFIVVSEILVTSGFGQAFIKKKDADSKDANTVFYTNLAISLILYLILFFCAPYISLFFRQPLLVDLLRVLAIVIVIRAMNVIQMAMIRKYLQFKKKAIITIISAVSSGIIGVVCAYSGLGVWSLVIQQLSMNTIVCILFYCTSSWKPALQFSVTSAKSMFSYGSWLLFSNVFANAMNHLYDFIIGRKYQVSDLGLYNRGQQYPQLITSTFTWVFGVVAFPSMTKLNDDRESMQQLTIKYVTYSCLIIFPLLCWLMVASKPLIIFLITEKWMACIPYLKLVCMSAFFTPVSFFFYPMLQALGYSKRDFESTVVMSCLRVINVAVSINYGIAVLLYGEIFVTILNLLYISFRNRKEMGFNYLTIFTKIYHIIIATVISFAIGSLCIALIGHTHMLVQIVFSFIVVIGVYIGFMALLQRNLLISSLKIIKRTF